MVLGNFGKKRIYAVFDKPQPMRSLVQTGCLALRNFPEVHLVVHLGQTHSNTQKKRYTPSIHVENVAEVMYLEDP